MSDYRLSAEMESTERRGRYLGELVLPGQLNITFEFETLVLERQAGTMLLRPDRDHALGQGR